ncbi:hypothetical protein GCM10010521_30430 [Streptomyces rameus]|uniref:Uncharacterized protein n=1 Tax=Streptomyces rameus TaxID=68261 RepID=A0ABP6NCT0_9ACTN
MGQPIGPPSSVTWDQNVKHQPGPDTARRGLKLCAQSAHLDPELPALKPFRLDAPVRPPVETPSPVVRPRPVTD